MNHKKVNLLSQAASVRLVGPELARFSDELEKAGGPYTVKKVGVNDLLIDHNGLTKDGYTYDKTVFMKLCRLVGAPHEFIIEAMTADVGLSARLAQIRAVAIDLFNRMLETYSFGATTHILLNKSLRSVERVSQTYPNKPFDPRTVDEFIRATPGDSFLQELAIYPGRVSLTMLTRKGVVDYLDPVSKTTSKLYGGVRLEFSRFKANKTAARPTLYFSGCGGYCLLHPVPSVVSAATFTKFITTPAQISETATHINAGRFLKAAPHAARGLLYKTASLLAAAENRVTNNRDMAFAAMHLALTEQSLHRIKYEILATEVLKRDRRCQKSQQ